MLGIEPKFSVVMCVNRANPWLNQAIDSVLEQDDGDFEFLISANACSDDLWEEIEEKVRSDHRVRLFRSSIGQLAFNLNLLADHARGEYLVRMDADDVCEPCRVGTLRRALRQHPVDVLGSAVTLIDGEGLVVGRMDFPLTQEDIQLAIRSRTTFCHPAVVLRRQFLLDMRGYLGGFVSEDTDLWLRAMRRGANMKNLPDALLRYRVHENQSIASRFGYAEVASHWLRELLISPSWYTFHGFAIAMGKSLMVSLLPGVRRYKKDMGENRR